jgi:hypothetical protein
VLQWGIVGAAGGVVLGGALALVLGLTLAVLVVWRRRTDRGHAAHAEDRGWEVVRPPDASDLPRLVTAAGPSPRAVVRFRGVVDGVPVDLVHLSIASVSGRADTDVFAAVAGADLTLPGVTVEPVGQVEKIVSAAGVRREMELGDPWFDRSFELFPHRGNGGISPEQIRDEVLTPGVQAALRRHEGVSLDVGGGHVIARVTGDGRHVAEVHRRLDEVAEVAAAVATSLTLTADDRVARARSAAGVSEGDGRIVTVHVDPRRRAGATPAT